MILDEIVVHNFGVFAGRQHVTLTPPASNKPVVLLGGLNGNGKTTLLRALELALYGSLSCSGRDRIASYDDCLRSWINRSVRTTDGASVEVVFRTAVDGIMRSFRVSRSWWLKGGRIREHLDVYVDEQTDKDASDGWKDYIEHLIPHRLSQLFFFDGERIETLADSDRSSGILRATVHALLGVDLVDQLAADLHVLERRRRKDTKQGIEKEEIRSQETLLGEYEQQERHLRQNRASLQSRRDRTASDLQKLEAQFRQEGGELAEARQGFELEKAAIEEHKRGLDSQLIDLAAGSLPLVLVQDLLGDVLTQARAESESARAQVLNASLAERDRALIEVLRKEKAPAGLVKTVDSFLGKDRSRYASAGDRPAYLLLEPEVMAQCDILLQERLSLEQDRARALLAQSEQSSTELDAIDRKLARVPDEGALARVTAELAGTRERITELDREIAGVDGQLLELERQKTVVKQRLDALLRVDKEAELQNNDTTRFLKHSERVRDTLQLFRSGLVGSSLSQLEELILNGYRQLLRKSSLVSSLHIDATSFALELRNGNHEPLPTERLSAGERQLLAVSILWGLARASGRLLPVVVDTPLGRLDSAHRSHLVERYFPHASHQVILLSTDEEIDRPMFQMIEPWLGRCYRLEYSEETASSSILPGYFWQEKES